MAKKNKNIVHYIPFDNIHVIGISTTLVDYKLAYYLNERFRYNLVRIGEVALEPSYQYSLYYYNEGENKNTFNLLSLKNKDHCYTKELQNLDYLLIVRDCISAERLEQLQAGIREIKNVMMATIIDIKRTPCLSNILDGIEFYEMQNINSPK